MKKTFEMFTAGCPLRRTSCSAIQTTLPVQLWLLECVPCSKQSKTKGGSKTPGFTSY